MDAADDLAAGPMALITDPSKSANNSNNPSQSAGMTFLGQFLDHYILSTRPRAWTSSAREVVAFS